MPKKRNKAPFTLYQRGGDGPWWADFRVARKRHRVSTGCRDRHEAEAAAWRLRQDAITAAGRPGRGEGADLAILAGLDHQRAVRKNRGAKQLASIDACWVHLCRILGAERDPRTINKVVMEDYVGMRREEGTRGQSIRKEVQALRRGLHIALDRQWIPEAPGKWEPVESDAPKASQKGKLVPEETLLKWLDAIECDPRAKGARAQAEVALRTGLRADELRKLVWAWVGSAPKGTGVSAMLHVPAEAAKNRKDREVGLTPRVLEILEAARAEHGWDEPLLPGNHIRAFRQAAREVGLANVTLRDLRHCHGTYAAQGTGDAAAAQAALGHTDLRTTQRYLSSTAARQAAAALAVDEILASAENGHTPWTHPALGYKKGHSDCAGMASLFDGRGGRIRTVDFLLPKQAR